MIRNVKIITAASFLAMLFMGVGGALVGAAARDIGLTAAQIGILIALQNLGFAVSVTVSGALADTRPKTTILFLGSLILGGSFLAFYVSPIYWINVGVMLFFGIGMGVYEGTADALLVDLHEARAPLFINVNHFFVTIGALAIALYLIFLQVNWRAAVVQSGILILALAVLFLLGKLPHRPQTGSGFREKMRVLAHERMLALLFLAAILAVGAEMGSIGILSTFLAEVRGYGSTAAKLALVVLLFGMAAGRLLIGFLVKPKHVLRYALVLFGLATPCFALLYLVDLGHFTYLAAFLAGLTLSSLLPLILTYAGLAYREMTGTVLGAIKLAIPVGGFVIPLLLTALTKAVSFAAAPVIFPVSLLLGFLLFALAGRMPKSA